MNIGELTAEYAAKLAATPRAIQELDAEEFDLFLEDLGRAKRELEVAWLEEVGRATSHDGGEW